MIKYYNLVDAEHPLYIFLLADIICTSLFTDPFESTICRGVMCITCKVIAYLFSLERKLRIYIGWPSHRVWPFKYNHLKTNHMKTNFKCAYD